MAGLGLPKFSRNANTVPSPGDLSDVERLEDFQEADFRGMTLSLSQETTDAVSPMQPPADQRGVDVSCLGSSRCRADAGSLNGNSGSAAENVSTASSSSIARQFSRELSEEETKEYFSVRSLDTDGIPGLPDGPELVVQLWALEGCLPAAVMLLKKVARSSRSRGGGRKE
ncbi:hypothetical protein HPB51_001103 [Rhipicephalus microplus]|uniref:Uncharacterized protein n=1 Tax=Rhipicephalus microplus TaxID=6941 RepID=A0A9J6EW12_RHIMP|nr:hypothetical protein HPB51_001103 [Rhipicephalus microplus]